MIVDTFNKIGNPLTRMQRMYDLMGSIINQYEENLNKNKEQPEHHGNYRFTPKMYDQIFHTYGNRKSSSEIVNT